MKRKISVLGLGYVGLPVAVAFGQRYSVVGFDINTKRLTELQSNHDRTGEISASELSLTQIKYTSDPEDLKESDFFIITVPTPIDSTNSPDLSHLLDASRTVAFALKPGDIVVYESTVYPGATEDECVPVLEKYSGLRHGIDFFSGYSPERINPGDRTNRFSSIRKVVSGCNKETLEIISEVYSSVIQAGIYKAASIKIAEAAKVIENTQRDLNIAFMNELSILFSKIGIDTHEVLATASTKWNFLPFKPGLVGGHCIGVDPYYLAHKAKQLGYTPEVILAGRRINNSMSQYIAQTTIKCMLKKGMDVPRCRIGVLGITFKENCPDIRNSKVIELVKELRDYGTTVVVADPHADHDEAREELGATLSDLDKEAPFDVLIAAVAHQEYCDLPLDTVRRFARGSSPIMIDVKGIYPQNKLADLGFTVFRL